MSDCNFSNETVVSNFSLLKRTYQWLVPCMWLALLAATICDFVVLSSVRFMRRNMSPNLHLSLSLAAADAWTASLMLCGLLVNSYIPVVFGINLLRRYKCAVFSLEFLRISAMLSSALHLFALAANHFYSIFYPLRYKGIIH